MSTVETYSTLLRNPTKVASLADHTEVVLERRDGDNLVLSSFTRFSQREQGAALTGRIIADVALSDPEVIARALYAELPWLKWLSREDQDAATDEILKDLLAGATTGNLSPFMVTLDAWKETAEIHSNKKIKQRLSGDFTGDGPLLSRP